MALLVAGLGGLVGVGGAVEVLIHHPHFANRLRAALMPASSGSSVPGIAPGALANVAVHVDSSAAGTAISPFIYGVAFADAATLKALGATVDRWGGNTSTRYNWVNGHAWNSARDWEWRNNNGGRGQVQMAEEFIAGALAGGAVPLVTIPSIGFVAKNDDNGTQSVGVPDTGGPPVAPGSSAIAGYDPANNRRVTSVQSFAAKSGQLDLTPPADSQPVYQNEWVHALHQKFGAASKGGVGYFAIDNEPDLWSYTHTDIHPVRMSYADMLSNFQQYAVAVKAQHPGALVLGPDVSGWTSYFYSDLDRGDDNFATHADRTAHGGQPFLPWWLGQVAQTDRARGSRSLDLLDVHFYPQGSNVFSDTADAATQALRIRSVRALHDPNYADESWISEPVQLVPRLKQWIAQQYPGTGLAITEYNWGGEKDASGAVALAEVLGTYGREGVDLATYWTYPPPDSPAGAAFRLYRNFDGNGATFGDISLPVTSSQPGVAVYAARHSSSHEVNVVLVNEASDQTATVQLTLGLGGTATQFQVVAGSSAIQRLPLGSLSQPVSLPPYSVSLIQVVPS
jgi:hypothetical protein